LIDSSSPIRFEHPKNTLFPFSWSEQIRGHIPEVTAYSDFLVLDQKLTVSIQPAVPIPHGYESYRPIRRDPRPVIDMTLGVLLSEPADFNILGFIALPRFGSNRLR